VGKPQLQPHRPPTPNTPASVVQYDDSSYIDGMKVTALIPDDLVAEVRALAAKDNLTESLIVALREWAAIQKMRVLRNKIKSRPLVFAPGFTAQSVRALNRT